MFLLNNADTLGGRKGLEALYRKAIESLVPKPLKNPPKIVRKKKSAVKKKRKK